MPLSTVPISPLPGQEDQSARLAASAEVGQVEGTTCPHCGKALTPSADVFDRIAGFPFEKCSCQVEGTRPDSGLLHAAKRIDRFLGPDYTLVAKFKHAKDCTCVTCEFPMDLTARQQIVDARTAFEKWATEETKLPLRRGARGGYMYPNTSMSWKAWRAAYLSRLEVGA